MLWSQIGRIKATVKSWGKAISEFLTVERGIPAHEYRKIYPNSRRSSTDDPSLNWGAFDPVRETPIYLDRYFYPWF